jgi:hypothetical protein
MTNIQDSRAPDYPTRYLGSFDINCIIFKKNWNFKKKSLNFKKIAKENIESSRIFLVLK